MSIDSSQNLDLLNEYTKEQPEVRALFVSLIAENRVLLENNISLRQEVNRLLAKNSNS
tara:strand:+ start:20492 stop:20665 length:174 start_codon:yes stop_codon:yes gene_type:complete